MDLPISETKLKRLTVDEVEQMITVVQATWDEVDQRNELMQLDPDYEIYKRAQEEDVWFFYTATYKGTTSFYSFFIQPSLHVKGTKQLIPDVIYVDPKHRGEGVADILLLAAENKAKEEGVKMISMTLKEFDKHNSLVERLGYTLYENTFQKVI
jgi:GNAT superfamily N-acetyltransferase